MAPRKFTFGAVQMTIGATKSENMQKAAELIARAVKGHATVVSLPECFNSTYGEKDFAKNAEHIPDGVTARFLSETAKMHKIYLIGGTIPETDGEKVYNTSTVFGPDGSMLLRYRKNHLFDMDIPGKCTFKESNVFTPGNKLATFDTPLCKIGIGICYDIRFAELGVLYSQRDCDMLVYPAQFDLYTSPIQWELLVRARALDNQVYVAAVSPARDDNADYVVYGHTTVASPWGDVVKKLGDKEDVLLIDIDLDRANDVKTQIPLRHQRRHDLYQVTECNN